MVSPGNSDDLWTEIEKLRSEVYHLKLSRCELDCRFTMGDVADIDGSHCPMELPCQRCQLERQIERLRGPTEP